MTDPRNGIHDRWDGDAAAYALHALEADEVRPFEEHLASCQRCQDELASFHEALAALPAAAPVVTPPPELKQRVMASVTADVRARTDSPQTSEPAAGRQTRPVPRWSAGRPSWRMPQIAVGLAAAVAVLVVVGLLTLGSGNSTRTFPGVVHFRGATASVVRTGNSGTLRFASMPAPPPGRIYEVWLQRRHGAPQPSSLFAARTGSVAVHGSMRGVRQVLVTTEPRPNGSQTPTRSPVIVVSLA